MKIKSTFRYINKVMNRGGTLMNVGVFVIVLIFCIVLPTIMMAKNKKE